MKPEDLSDIERKLSIALPEDYKQLLLNPPPFIEPNTDDDFLFDNPESIIEANQEYRRGFAGLAPWPNHYYLIGNDGAASCYFLDLNKNPSPVFLADHGNINDISEEAKSLANWIKELKELDLPIPSPNRHKINLAIVIAWTLLMIGLVILCVKNS